MLLGLIARSATFAINASLVFVLSERAPRLDWWNAQPKSSLFETERDTILTGLARVRADLETNGKLLIPAQRPAVVLSRDDENPRLDQRALRIKPVTD
jgi:hypothetical protein